MSAIASQITSLMMVYSIVYSDADQRHHQSSASLAFVWGIHRGPVNSPHKWPVTRKMFPFDDVIMEHTASRSPRTFGPIYAAFVHTPFFSSSWSQSTFLSIRWLLVRPTLRRPPMIMMIFVSNVTQHNKFICWVMGSVNRLRTVTHMCLH